MSLWDPPPKKKKNDRNIYNMTKDYWEEIIKIWLILLLGQWVGALMAVAERIGEEWSASDGIEQSEAHKTMSI